MNSEAYTVALFESCSHTSFRKSSSFHRDCIHEVHHSLPGEANTRISLQRDFRPVSHRSRYITEALYMKTQQLLYTMQYSLKGKLHKR